MHILFLTDNFPPEVNAPATRTFEHCRAWVEAGHRVTVITGAPNFPTGRVFPGYRNRWWFRETMDGIEVVRVWTYITSNEGVARRTLDYASYMMAAVPATLAVDRFDIIVATSPQLFTPCAGWIASRLRRTPYVFELRDLWPESIRAVGALANRRILHRLEQLELFLYRRAAHIVSVTHAFKDNLVTRGIAPDKISVVRNGADLSRFSPRPRDLDLAARLGITDEIVVGYVGTHGMAHALSTVLAAAARIKAMSAEARIRFLFLGDGAEKAALREQARKLALDNVIFLDTVPRDEVARYWSLLDVALIHLKRTPLFETVIPSKLFECMAMGIPVLHGVAGESARIVTTENVGIVFEPENDAALATHVLELAGDAPLRRRLAANAAHAAPSYAREASAREMLAVLEDAVRRSQSGTALVKPARDTKRVSP
jgi:glycosyltransferase involved in cell wall biosynthesis